MSAPALGAPDQPFAQGKGLPVASRWPGLEPLRPVCSDGQGYHRQSPAARLRRVEGMKLIHLARLIGWLWAKRRKCEGAQQATREAPRDLLRGFRQCSRKMKVVPHATTKASNVSS
jgi:hypothetical protein